ncbi:nicotinamide-nucleotide amidohydrolase family protein [Tersicoccus sp. MR15.9]|uniref:CinA family protein n=1 Tax=Tersicoccus mangrovi TaxID=3121635 RepID=UPI002FE5F341
MPEAAGSRVEPGRVIAAAVERGLTVATAESLTGGAVCAALVDVPGASAAVRGGVVSYHRDVKVALLGVDPGRLASHGAVDPEVAAQMAAGARTATGADVAVATTGVAGPEPHDGQPVGTVWIGVATHAGASAALHQFAGDRDAVRVAARDAALAALLEAVETV